MIVRSACLSIMAMISTPAGASEPTPYFRPSSLVAALGDIAAFQSITVDVLTLTGRGDIAAAQKRGTELETAWDEAEDKLKASDPTRWRVIDKAIDHVLAELRAAQPQQAKIEAAVRGLLATINKGGAA